MRSGLPLRLLAFVAAALVATITFTLRGPTREDKAIMPRPAANPPTAAPGRPAEAHPGQTARWATTSLTRPLFSPSRRPPADLPATPGAAAPSLPRVAGVVVTPSGRQAIFVAKHDAKPLVIGEGGQVGAFTVQSIQAGQVTLRGPEGERVLKPVFDAELPAPPQPAPPPTPETPVPAALALPGQPGTRS